MEDIYITSEHSADMVDDRDLVYEDLSDELPSSIDLREYAREIENQGRTGSCVANATVSALELLASKRNEQVNLSRLFLYYNLREPYANLKDKDKGSYLRDGFKIINKQGICTESIWKFDSSKVNTKPSDESYIEAKDYIVLEYARVVLTRLQRNLKNAKLDYTDDMGVDLMKSALSKGYPITISISLGREFYKLGGVKTLENMKYAGVNNDSIGGHAMNVVGYNDELGGFIVENSWGKNWGADGFCLISYDVIKKDCNDVWVCTKFSTPASRAEEKRLADIEKAKETKQIEDDRKANETRAERKSNKNKVTFMASIIITVVILAVAIM